MVNRPDLHVIIVQRHMHASHFALKAKENCSLIINRNHGEELIAGGKQVKDGPIWLKVEVDRLTRRFFIQLRRRRLERGRCIKWLHLPVRWGCARRSKAPHRNTSRHLRQQRWLRKPHSGRFWLLWISGKRRKYIEERVVIYGKPWSENGRKNCRMRSR